LNPIEEIDKKLKGIDLDKLKDKKAELKAAEAEIKRLEAEKGQLQEKDGLEKWRKARIEAIFQALTAALNSPEGKSKKIKPGDVVLNTARPLWPYWSLTPERYKEAIEHGEAFPYNASAESSPQAAESPIYALQASVAVLGKSPNGPAVT